MDFITFKHSFNAGDLITVLPGIKHICEKNNTKAIIYQRLGLIADYGHSDPHPVLNESNREVCMNMDVFELIKPLIEAQEYVHSFRVWSGEQVTFDYDKTRHNSQMPLPGGSIHKWPSLIYPQLECDTSTEWISVDGALDREIVGKRFADFLGVQYPYIVINRTNRYANPYISFHFLKEFERRILFVGTKKEAKDFTTSFDLNITWYEENRSFFNLAAIIRSAIFFIGNQSMCWHFADAMKVPRILEVCAQYPNTFPTGRDGYSFIKQEALEFRFHKLLNERNA